MFRHTLFLFTLLAGASVASAQMPTLDGALKQIRDTKTVAIAYRVDARPFSFEQGGQPTGYTIDLCKRVVASLEQQLGVQPLNVKWVPATSQNRLELVASRRADMECGATTATLSRMEQVDFSSAVFVDSTGLLVRKSSGAKVFGDLAGRKIAVVGGTTNDAALKRALVRQLVNASVVTVGSRDEALAALEAGTVDAYASDKLLLLGSADKVKDPSQYQILNDDLSFEPYAIVLPRSDAAFRLAVNRGLAQVYRSDAIVEIFKRSFGANVAPPPGLVVMYGLGAYAD